MNNVIKYIEENRDRLINYSYSILKNRDAAEDIVQGALVYLLTKSNFSDEVNLEAYSLRIVRNASYRYHRDYSSKEIPYEHYEAKDNRDTDSEIFNKNCSNLTKAETKIAIGQYVTYLCKGDAFAKLVIDGIMQNYGLREISVNLGVSETKVELVVEMIRYRLGQGKPIAMKSDFDSKLKRFKKDLSNEFYSTLTP